MTTEKGVYVLGWMGDDDLGDLCYFLGKEVGRYGGREVRYGGKRWGSGGGACFYP